MVVGSRFEVGDGCRVGWFVPRAGEKDIISVSCDRGKKAVNEGE